MSVSRAKLTRYLQARLRKCRRQLAILSDRETLPRDDPGFIDEAPARNLRAAINGAAEEVELLLCLLVRR